MRAERIEEIRQIAREMSYQPNQMARQLAGMRSGVLGVITDQIQTSTHARIMGWLHYYAAERGFQLLATQTDNKASRIRKALGEFNSRGIEGIINVSYLNDAYWNEIGDLFRGCHNVISLFGRPPVENGCFIDVNVEDGARQAVMHLAGRGKNKIVLILDDLQLSWDRYRRDGFIAAHSNLGRDIDRDQIIVLPQAFDWNQPDVGKRTDRLIEQLVASHVDAIVTDDTMAGLLSHALLRAGIRVPDQIAVVGQCNDVIVHYMYPRLTTVEINVRLVTEQAIRMLADVLESPQDRPLESKVIEPELIIRDST